MLPPDALREALGQVIADQRREWRRERELMEAQSRQVVAELRARIVELEAAINAKVEARLSQVKGGAPGERGEAGVPGERGEIGPAGEQGPQGDPGAPGECGERGEPGEPGERGDRGENGEPGERGEKGERGDVGIPGERGAQGEAGPRGEPGIRGEAGAQGERGLQGERGDRGPTGDRGKIGRLPATGEWEDRVYHDSDVVAFAGALYQAGRDTGKAPPHEDWHCIVPAPLNLNPRSTWAATETYRHLDIVALDGGAFVARRDDPGPCPGEGWQLITTRGKPGRPGDKGAPGPAVVGISIDVNGVVTIENADGTRATGDFYPVLSRLSR